VSVLRAPDQLLVLGASSGSESVGPAPQVLAGLAPNGAATVAIDFSDGSSVTVPVINNGFLLNPPAGRMPTAFRWSVNGVSFTEKP
jgi:hypothetical protein